MLQIGSRNCRILQILSVQTNRNEIVSHGTKKSIRADNFRHNMSRRKRITFPYKSDPKGKRRLLATLKTYTYTQNVLFL